MKHFIYKITHTSGLYYIGRHSTINEDDGYMGSGAWVTGIIDRSTLTKEILQYVDTLDDLLVLEEQFIAEHIDNDSNMNILLSSGGFKPGVENFSDPELVRQKQSAARSGKTWEEIFGVERATELRIERSQPRGEMGEEQKKSISAAKEGMTAPHDWSEESRAKLSKSMTGVVRSQEFKDNQRKNVSVTVICEYCGTTGGGIAMRRWHGKNCKHNTKN